MKKGCFMMFVCLAALTILAILGAVIRGWIPDTMSKGQTIHSSRNGDRISVVVHGNSWLAKLGIRPYFCTVTVTRLPAELQLKAEAILSTEKDMNKARSALQREFKKNQTEIFSSKLPISEGIVPEPLVVEKEGVFIINAGSDRDKRVLRQDGNRYVLELVTKSG